MESEILKKGKDLVKAIEGQHAPGTEHQIISFSAASQKLVKELVAALEKAEKRIVYLQEEVDNITEHYFPD